MVDLPVVAITAVVAVVIGVIIERIAVSLISNYGKKKSLPPSPIHLMKLIVRWIIVIVVIIAVAGIFGISLGSLWISISVFITGILVGFFAVWSIFGNILAALVVMIWRPFKVGDKIAILPENFIGEVAEMNLIYTTLKTEEGDSLQTPNLTFVTKFIRVYAKR